MTTWRDLISQAESVLNDAGVGPGPDARLIAESASGIDARAAVGPGAPEPSGQQEERFSRMVAQRARRVPLQHVIGTMWFRYLELVSRPGAFIVRPETEQVTQAAIDALEQMAREQTAASASGAGEPIVVDLCTGSGAIALAIATEVPASRVFGVELSPEAYDVAAENNRRYNDVVHMELGDARTALDELAGRVDVVITNPPYVPPYHELSPEVRQDPELALFGGGGDGLELPRELVARSRELLRDGGILIMEHAEEQARALRENAQSNGFVNVTTGRDLAGRDRYLRAEKAGIDDAH